MTVISNPVRNSLEIIFGGAVSELARFSQDPRTLQTDVLKRAYRLKMKRSHPDMAAATGIDISVLNEESQKLNEAYSTLMNLVDKDRVNNRLNFHHHGPVPSRRLRFGEYLYYRGAINWRTLIDSLVWQYRQRPKFGEICVLLGYLNEGDASKVLLKRKTTEKFGDTAVRLGLIDGYKRNVVMGRQKSFDSPIGKYFTNNGLLTKTQIGTFLNDVNRHNLKFPSGLGTNIG